MSIFAGDTIFEYPKESYTQIAAEPPLWFLLPHFGLISLFRQIPLHEKKMDFYIVRLPSVV